MEDRIEIPAVDVRVAERGRAAVRIGVVLGVDRRKAQRDADRGIGARRPVRLDGRAVREEEMVRHAQLGDRVGQAGRHAAHSMADRRHHPRLVVGDPPGDAVAERLVHDRRVLDEALHDVAVLPATTILKRLGKVPVIERRRRLHALLEKALAEAPIEVDALLVRGAHPGGLDPGPGDAEAIRVEAVGSDEVDVLRPAVIVVAGDIPGVAVCDVSGRMTEGVPDGRAAAILVDGALDLVAGGGGSPGELRRKRHRTPLVRRWLSCGPRLAKLQGS